MPRYVVDPSAALGQGIEDAGGAFAQAILLRKKRKEQEQQQENEQQAQNVLGEALDEADRRAAVGGDNADFLSDPRAVAKWLRDNGHWDTLVGNGTLGDFFKGASWFHGPADTGEKWVSATPDQLAKEFGGKPEDYPGTWRIGSKSRRPEQITKPGEVKEPEAPKTRTRDVGNEQVTEEWDPAQRKYVEIGRAPRWQGKEAPEAIAPMSSTEVETLYGLEPGTLKGRMFQRNAVTGRLSEIGSKDPLAAFMALTAPAPAAQEEDKPSLLERGKRALGLGKKPSIADRFRNAQ